MGFKELIKKLKNELLKVRKRKYKLALLEKNLRSMRQLAVKIKENGAYFTPRERAKIEDKFETLQAEVRGLEAELQDDNF